MIDVIVLYFYKNYFLDKTIYICSRFYRFIDETENYTGIESLKVEQGLSVGAVWTIKTIAERMGIVKALGKTRMGVLALWLVCARLIDQGSRLSAVRLAGTHAACDVLGIDESFNIGLEQSG